MSDPSGADPAPVKPRALSLSRDYVCLAIIGVVALGDVVAAVAGVKVADIAGLNTPVLMGLFAFLKGDQDK